MSRVISLVSVLIPPDFSLLMNLPVRVTLLGSTDDQQAICAAMLRPSRPPPSKAPSLAGLTHCAKQW